MRNFRSIDRDTDFLMPPSVNEWLPERHLARLVVEVIAGLDLRAMTGAYRGSGEASYHPRVLLGLIVYGYATGVFSSRKLEHGFLARRTARGLFGEMLAFDGPGRCGVFALIRFVSCWAKAKCGLASMERHEIAPRRSRHQGAYAGLVGDVPTGLADQTETPCAATLGLDRNVRPSQR